MDMRVPAIALAAYLALTGAPVAQPAIEARTVLEGLQQPVFLTSPADDPRLFILEQGGRIRIAVDGELRDNPFLDLGGEVLAGGERGLLGLAFHPEYAENGRFFVNYTDRAGDTRIVGYRVSDDPDRADPASASPILDIPQPAGNHNGGWLGFGPDGLLYIGVGDGGGGGDQFGNGQNPDTLLGSILRLDVDGGAPYAIPAGNPFAGGGGAPEIFAIGARNPWRASFDSDELYIADVGQNRWEEINVITTADAGANLGWNIMEGSECFNAESCETAGLVLPVHTYSHDLGCSVTGGYVYRGAAMPDLDGHYFFGDYCSGALFSFRQADGAMSELTDWTERLGSLGAITSFGVDSRGELYITLAEGRVLQLVPAE
jgi:glucose/arabinose dehydrogenase